MTNEHSQLLVPIRVTGSNPYIAPKGGASKAFVPGNAVYFAPRDLAYISDHVEFFFVH